MKNFINFLPPWVETNIQPAFYDKESGTCLQQTARMYAKVNQLIRHFNDLSKETRETVAEFIAKFVELKDFVDTYFENLDVQEEINNKLDAMVESGEFSEIVSEYLEQKVDYIVINSSSTNQDILDAFADNRAKVINFETGEYTIEGKIILTSNTIVNLNGASLKMYDASTQILGYATDSTWTAYNGIHNVEFNNGEIEIPFALMHNVNIVFKNINFLPSVTHAIQMAGCKDIVIDSCTFNGQKLNDSIQSQYETIQLESATRGGQPFLDDSDSVSYDSYGNYNIQITNCIFNAGDDTTTRNYTAIGSHSSDDDNHYCNKKILIKGCTFGNSYYSQMCPCGFDDATIEDNIFNQTAEVNYIYSIRLRFYNRNLKIVNNKFIGGWTNISSVNVSDYIDNVLIRGNHFNTTFTDGQSNIILVNMRNVIIDNNIFEGGKNHNIQVAGSASYTPSGITIKNNHFTYSKVTGSSKSAIQLVIVSGIEIYKNTFIMDNNNCYAVYITSATSEDYSIYGNYAIEDGTTTKFISSDGNPDYTTSQNIYQTLYTGSSTYTAVSQTPTVPFSRFNRLLVSVHPNNDGSDLTTLVLRGWNVSGKLEARKYPIAVGDGSGNIKQGLLEIKANGDFAYTSSTDYLVLRAIRGYNENVAI